MRERRTKNQLLSEIDDLEHRLDQALLTNQVLRAELRSMTGRKHGKEQVHRLNAELEQRDQQPSTDADESLQQAMQALRESDARFRSVLESSLDAAYRRNLRTDRYDYMSPAIQRLTGFTVDEFSSLSIEQVLMRIHPDDLPRVEREIERTMTGEQGTGSVEYRLQGKNGEYRWLSDNISTLKDEQGVPVYRVGSIRDITERKEIEERIQDLNRELERRNADLNAVNKELESFSYSVSHDLRTPLAHISGFARLVLDEYGGQVPAEVQRYLRIIDTSAMTMGELIEGLLRFSRIGRHPIEKQKVIMTDLVREVLDTLTLEQKDRQIEIAVGRLPDAKADPFLLKQVWVNLLSNALKFTRDRDPARIQVGSGEWKVDSEGRGSLLVSGDSLPTNNVVYFVRDNGAGFDMARADRLFRVFQRFHSDEDYPGTGVGLAIVDRIVHRHGGRVWAEAWVDAGATFYFTL